jgi:hypothetical protein
MLETTECRGENATVSFRSTVFSGFQNDGKGR